MDIYCVAQIRDKPYKSVLKLVNYNGIKWEWQCADGSIRHFSIKLSVPHFYSPKRIFCVSGWHGPRGYREFCLFEEGDLSE